MGKAGTGVRLALALVLGLAACGGKEKRSPVSVTAGAPTAAGIPVEVKTLPLLHVEINTRDVASEIKKNSWERKITRLAAGRADGAGLARITVPMDQLAPQPEGLELLVYVQEAAFEEGKPVYGKKGYGMGSVKVQLPYRVARAEYGYKILGPDCSVDIVPWEDNGKPVIVVKVMGAGKCTDAVMKVGGKTLEKQHQGIVNISATLDCATAIDLAKLDPRTLKQKLAVELTIGTGTATVEQEVDASTCAGELAKKVVDGGLTFPGESKDAGAAKTAVLLRPYGREWDIVTYGAPATFAAVDLVAVETIKQRTFTCRYSGGQSTARGEGDATIAVYQRRTGTKLGTKDFRAPPGKCAGYMKVFTKTNLKTTEGGQMYTRVPEEAIRELVQGFLK